MKIKIIREVYSKKQRKFFCASDDPELKAMCDDPMKEEEQIEETSGAGGGAVAGGVGARGGPWAEEAEEIRKDNEAAKPKKTDLDEMYSTQGQFHTGQPLRGDEFKGFVERSAHQGLQNTPKRWKVKFSRRMEEGEDTTQPTQGNISGDSAGIKWKLSDFTDTHRNVNRMMAVWEDIEQNIGLPKLQKAILADNSAASRLNVMSEKFGYDNGLMDQIQENDSEAIMKYYQFLITEFLFWVALNPMSSAQQYAQRSAMLSQPTRDLAYALVSQYVANPNKNNPETKGQKMSDQADFYKLDKDLDPALYQLPEE